MPVLLNAVSSNLIEVIKDIDLHIYRLLIILKYINLEKIVGTDENYLKMNIYFYIHRFRIS